MPDLGWQELAIILVIVIIIFGAGRLPEIGGAVGKSIKEFRSNAEGVGQIGKGSATASTDPTLQSAATREVRADEI